jgi:hypothetical protein
MHYNHDHSQVEYVLQCSGAALVTIQSDEIGQGAPHRLRCAGRLLGGIV